MHLRPAECWRAVWGLLCQQETQQIPSTLLPLKLTVLHLRAMPHFQRLVLICTPRIGNLNELKHQIEGNNMPTRNADMLTFSLSDRALTAASMHLLTASCTCLSKRLLSTLQIAVPF